MQAIRLADRRGVLRGSSLSSVQELALKMLMIHEDQERKRRDDRSQEQFHEMRLAVAKAGLLATGAVPLKEMFPEYTPAPTAEEAYESDGPVEMISDFDPEHARRIAAILERARSIDSGALGIADLDFDDEDI